jgi:hypothetical protein
MRADLLPTILAIAAGFMCVASGFVTPSGYGLNSNALPPSGSHVTSRLATAKAGETEGVSERHNTHGHNEKVFPLERMEVLTAATGAIPVLAVATHPAYAVAAEVGEKTQMSPVAEAAGTWIFVAYVGFSLLAGAKEMVVRFQKWRMNNSD